MPPDSTTDRLLDRLHEFALDHDRPAMVAEALRAIDAGEVTVPVLYHDVLVPLMKRIGEGWQLGRLRVWEEHLVSAGVRTIVESLHPRVMELKAAGATAGTTAGRSVLLACPPGEEHDLGLRMLADVFEVNGWTTYYLGADTPTLQIADAAAMLAVDLVVLASVTLFDQVQTRRVLDDLHARDPRLKVLVACSADICSGTGVREDEIFVARDVFGGVHPEPGAPRKSGGR
jgi:methanogenic corrinoid protein MtbC1